MRTAILLPIFLLLLAGNLEAQTKTGTTIGQFTLIEPSARVAAMGGAGVTSFNEALAGYYNPAALGLFDFSDVQFTHNAWFADISINYGAGAFRIGGIGTLAAFVTYLTSGDIDVRTVEQPTGTGERYQVTDLLLGVGYGVRITDRFSCGIQVNYVQEQIWHSSTSVFGVNIGTLYELSADGLKIGASLMNFGTKNHFSGTDLRVRYDIDPARYGDNSSVPGEIITDDFSLPIVFRVGLGYPLIIDGSNTVNLAVDGLTPSDNSPAVNLGAEWVFKRVFAVRLGYSSLFQVDSEFGLTAGAGVAWDGLGNEIRADYSWGNHRSLGGVQRFTLAVAF
jgi:long-subunit fatty acid transport protein